MADTTNTTTTAPPADNKPATGGKVEGSVLSDVMEIPTPDTRPLKCYAFDPSHGKFFGNEMTLHVSTKNSASPELKGLQAKILGPPPRKAKAFLSLMDLKKVVGPYLDSMMTDGDES